MSVNMDILIWGVKHQRSDLIRRTSNWIEHLNQIELNLFTDNHSKVIQKSNGFSDFHSLKLSCSFLLYSIWVKWEWVLSDVFSYLLLTQTASYLVLSPPETLPVKAVRKGLSSVFASRFPCYNFRHVCLETKRKDV